MRRRELCSIAEIDWDVIFNEGQPTNHEPDPEGALLGIDLLVKRYTEMYPADERRLWIERRLRAWWQGRE